jgi:hypothetical protein
MILFIAPEAFNNLHNLETLFLDRNNCTNGPNFSFQAYKNKTNVRQVIENSKNLCSNRNSLTTTTKAPTTTTPEPPTTTTIKISPDDKNISKLILFAKIQEISSRVSKIEENYLNLNFKIEKSFEVNKDMMKKEIVSRNFKDLKEFQVNFENLVDILMANLTKSIGINGTGLLNEKIHELTINEIGD